jgi:hypothetical protein
MVLHKVSWQLWLTAPMWQQQGSHHQQLYTLMAVGRCAHAATRTITPKHVTPMFRPAPAVPHLLWFSLLNLLLVVTNCPGGGLTLVLTGGSSGLALLLLLLTGCSSRSLWGV